MNMLQKNTGRGGSMADPERCKDCGGTESEPKLGHLRCNEYRWGLCTSDFHKPEERGHRETELDIALNHIFD